MIAKNIKLNISELKKSSLQFSLQSCQLSTFSVPLLTLALCLQKLMFLQTVCKVNPIQYQSIKKFSFASLFAKNSN